MCLLHEQHQNDCFTNTTTRPLRQKGPRLFALQKSSKMSIQIPSIERTELWKPWPSNSSMIHRWKMVVFHSNCYQRVWKEAVAADVNRHNGVGLKHQRRIAIASPVYPRVKPGSEKGYPKLCFFMATPKKVAFLFFLAVTYDVAVKLWIWSIARFNDCHGHAMGPHYFAWSKAKQKREHRSTIEKIDHQQWHIPVFWALHNLYT